MSASIDSYAYSGRITGVGIGVGAGVVGVDSGAGPSAVQCQFS